MWIREFTFYRWEEYIEEEEKKKEGEGGSGSNNHEVTSQPDKKQSG